MSTVAEITKTLPKLTNSELQEVEAALRRTKCERHLGIIFDDTYGQFSEEDLEHITAQALAVMDALKPSK